jgi:hypothetical protein
VILLTPSDVVLRYIASRQTGRTPMLIGIVLIGIGTGIIAAAVAGLFVERG